MAAPNARLPRWSPARGAASMCSMSDRNRQRRHRHRRQRSGDACAARWCGWRRRTAARSINCRPASRCSTPSSGWRSTTTPIARCGISTAPFSISIPTNSACSTSCAPRANCPSSRISGHGRRSCTRPIAPTKPGSIPGICPTARTLSVVTTPNPEGGVTYLFHDVTERLDLERRFDGLIRVQGETLDNLAEGVAVFASNGRLRLHNPAFARMWKLSPTGARGTAAYRDHNRFVPAAARRRADLAGAARGDHRDRQPQSLAGSWSGATAACWTARRCRCPTAPPW